MFMPMRFQVGDLVAVIGWRSPSLRTTQGRIITALGRSPAHRQTGQVFERELVSLLHSLYEQFYHGLDFHGHVVTSLKILKLAKTILARSGDNRCS
jgi:hypothetical protein